MTQLSGASGARSLGRVLGRRSRARGPGGAWMPRKKCARAYAARIRQPPPAGARASVPPMAEGGTSRKAPTFSASVDKVYLPSPGGLSPARAKCPKVVTPRAPPCSLYSIPVKSATKWFGPFKVNRSFLVSSVSARGHEEVRASM